MSRETQIPSSIRMESVDRHSYYPFIDGLRAIAILAVVLYHAGVPGVTGGFIGVDVFFVISGFLIIGIILRGLEAGKFSLWSFYARRTLRIIPPFLIVLLASSIIASVVLVSPTEIEAFGASMAWSAMMGANIHLYLEQGYFDSAAETKPLLNMWSLAVEEQFYLLTPFILMAAALLPRRMVRASLLSMLVLASFVACIMFTRDERNLAFYMAPLRAWQFAVGGAIYGIAPYLSGRRLAAQVVGFVGLAAIGASVVLFSGDLLYPSYFAALPTIGAAALLLAGIVHDRAFTTQFLATKPLRAIGLVSYSWYLWHWPLLTFWRITRAGQTTLTEDVGIVILALLLSIITYITIERPIGQRRQRLSAGGWRTSITLAGLALGAAISLSATAIAPGAAAVAKMSITPEIWPRTDKRAKMEKKDPCFLRRDATFNVECTSLLSGKRALLLAGDSHSAMLYPYLFRLSTESDFRIITQYSNGCRPFLISGPAERCKEYFDETNAAIQAEGISYEMAILTGAWNREIHGIGWRSTKTSSEVEQRLALLESGMERSISYLQKRGVNRILLIGPVPEFPAEIPTCLLRANGLGIAWDFCGLTRSVVEDRRAPIVAMLKAVADRHEDVRYVDPINVFCGATVCLPYSNGKSLYTDSHHLSLAGSEATFSMHQDDLNWLLGRPGSAHRAASLMPTDISQLQK